MMSVTTDIRSSLTSTTMEDDKHISSSPSIVLLVMSCNDHVISSCVDALSHTLGEETKKYPYIKYLTYSGGNQHQSLSGDKINCMSDDSLDGTFLKTQEALSFVKKMYDPDYVVRINSSTYVNLELLVNFLESEHRNQSCKMLHNGDVSDLDGRIQLRGNSFILGRRMIDKIIDFDLSEAPDDIENFHDDVVISYIVQKEIGLDKTTEEIIRSEKIGIVPMIYLNDFYRIGHPTSVIDKLLIPERMRRHIKAYNKEEIDELIKNNIFIAYRKNYVRDRYQEIGECYKIRDSLKDFKTDKIPELVKEFNMYIYKKNIFKKIAL